MTFHDVIVVGAGPAGATAARLLAEQGVEVALLEKESLPRYKACGGGVSGRAASLLTQELPEGLVEDITRQVTLRYRGRWPVTITNQAPIVYMTMRSRFDQWLVAEAAAAGAVLHEETRVTGARQKSSIVEVDTSRGCFRARVLVGADGVHSSIGKQFGLGQNHLRALALETELFVDDALLEKYKGSVLLDYGLRPNGYAWIFPKQDHLSIGAGIWMPDADAQRLRLLLSRFRQVHNLTGRVKLQRGFFLPVGGGPLEPVQAGHVLLIGDAAGLVDPLFGEGIYYALRSARLAVAMIVSALQHPPIAHNLEQYTNRLETEVLTELQTVRRFAEFFYRWSALFHTAFILKPMLIKRVMKALAGELSLIDVLPVSPSTERRRQAHAQNRGDV